MLNYRWNGILFEGVRASALIPAQKGGRRSVERLALSLGLLFVAPLLATGCSSGNGPVDGSGGAGGVSGGTGELCALEGRVGRFGLSLEHEAVAPAMPAPAYSQLIGAVRDGVVPSDVWVVSGAPVGTCRLMVGPTFACSPACTPGNVCKAGACVAAPVSHSVGKVTVTGLLAPTSITPNGSNTYYWPSAGLAYPPFTPGGMIGLVAAGGDYPPGFSLSVRGIQPLEVPEGQSLPISTTKSNQDLVVTWEAPPATAAGRMFLSLDIAHHGGVAAQVQCDVPDSGSGTIPGALLDALVAKGAFGFPEITLTRQSVDSTTIAPGCVEFVVLASLRRSLMVEGITSCTSNAECPTGQTCEKMKCS